MTQKINFRFFLIYLLPILSVISLSVVCEAEAPKRAKRFREPVFRVQQNPPQVRQVRVGEHPLVPALRIAEAGLENINKNVRDYSCTLVKRELVNGKLGAHEYMFVKVRHEQKKNNQIVSPFSVYMYFLGPVKVKGREVLYVQGRNNGKLVAHEGGNFFGGALIRKISVNLLPTSKLAMRGNRYPITEIGIKNLVTKLIEVAKADMKYGECEVNFYNGAKVDGRKCTCIEVNHPLRRDEFRYHKARIYLDDELNVPIRFAAWDWPKKKGGRPVLMEEYTYTNLNLNVGLTDADFDRKNVKYAFR